MAYALFPSHEIEEVDLTADPEPKQSQSQRSHFNVQLCDLNRAESRKNKPASWRHNTDDLFRAIKQPDTSTYCRDRILYPDRDTQIGENQTNHEWQPFSKEGFNPTTNSVNESNESSLEILMLESVKESLGRGDAAVKLMWAEIASARSEMLPIFLHRVQDAHREIKQQLAQLEAAIKSLTESNTASEKALEQRQASDEQMLDTVMFLKQCLDSHADLVDLVMGRPQPLVKQGMELMQGLLDEMFGLPPGPVTQTPAIEYETEDEAEVENRLELELERQSDSEVEYLWEQAQAEDLMDVEASEASQSESEESDNDEDDSISEGLDDYADDDNTSECSNYSTTILTEHERTSRKRKERREKAKRARNALWKRFGLRVEDAEEERGATQHEERSRIKRQKRNRDTVEEEPVENNLTAQDRPPGLRQSTLNFNKVTKNRRLFSRRELKEQGILETEERDEEESTDDTLSPIRKDSKRHPKIRAEQKAKEILAGCHPTRRRTDRGWVEADEFAW